MPTEAGLALFGILKRADPALVDPGVTAQLECLLDDVVVGKQEMVGAIDAVCDVAQRIIGKLKEGGVAGGIPLLRAAAGSDAGERPPTTAMKRFADNLARQKGIKPPPDYRKSASTCRTFLIQNSPKKPGNETAVKTVQDNGVFITDESTANSDAKSASIESNQSTRRGNRSRKTSKKPSKSAASKSTGPKKRSGRRTTHAAAAPQTAARQESGMDTPLRIPYGNKEVALKLGARYRSGQWYAPPGVDLAAFSGRGWLPR